MATLPYINLPQSQAPGLIGDIGDTLVQAAQRQQQQKQQAIENLLKQKQMEAQEAQMRAQEARAQAEAARQEHYAIQEQHRYEHAQRQEAAGAIKPMNEMFASGDAAGALALGQTHGYNLKLANGLEAPGAAPQAPQQPSAPVDNSDASYDALNMNRSAEQNPSDVQNQQQEAVSQQAQGREQYAAALADHPRLVADHAQKIQAFQQAKANPVYKGDSPFGPVEFNPGAVRAQKQAQQEQQAATASEGLPPKYALRLAALVKSGELVTPASQQVRLEMKDEEDRTLRRETSMTGDQKFTAQMRPRGGHGSGSGQGGKNAPPTAAEAELAGMAADPKNSAEALRLFASQHGIRLDRGEKIIAAAKGQEKTTAGQEKDAQQAAQGLRAIESIKATGYTPSRDDIQKWLNNQREVENANNMSKDGLLGTIGAGVGQGAGLLAQNETEGLPDKAREYFANVRRYMEVTGRKQSGAAINKGEWDNFYAQFGPNAPGGVAAAEKNMQDQLASTGKAGVRLGRPAANSLTNAAKIKSLPDEDQKAVKMALERIGKDPNDQIAKRVLEMHGM